MKYVITGATSFIGLELVGVLLSRGHSVIAVCRDGSRAAVLPDGVEVVVSDMEGYGALDGLTGPSDVFVNLAWAGTGHEGRDDAALQELNVRHTLEAAGAAVRMGCRLFVESGSQAEYGFMEGLTSEEAPCNPVNEYGKAKLSVKENGFRLADNTGMKYLHLRIFSIFGENDHPWTLVRSCTDKLLRGEDVDLSACTQKWNFLYVKDAAMQIALLTEYAVGSVSFRKEVFNIASDDTRVLKEYVEEIRSIAGGEGKLRYGAIASGRPVSLDPDVSKTRGAIGFIASHTFGEIIENYCRQYDKSI